MVSELTRRQVLVRGFSAAAAVAGATITGRSSTARAAGPAVHKIRITSFEFVPSKLTVRPGDRIEWTNEDIVPHTATGLGDVWDTGKIGRNQTGSITVTAGMQTSYFCRYHPMMKATLTIA